METARAIKNTDQKYTYADYLTWDDGQRWELINGEAYCMSPAPGVRHQKLSVELSRQFANHLKGKSCQVFSAPFDVRLSERSTVSDNYIETVVQPDLLVICDKIKLDDRGCNGAPDLVIEILSPSTAAVDFKIKFDLYQRFGVLEYWIVHPAELTLLVYKRGADGLYGAGDRYAVDDKVPVPLLGDLMIDLAEVFAEE
ncbi:MAG: Uma2 family endonuclease [Geobacter sp.]|nr:Uma2 family endonuclease [Geobacter sp.]